MDVIARFLAKVQGDPNGGCWLWEGAGHDYGTFWLDGVHEYAHRVAYRLFVGELPDGAQVRHKCDVSRCVNPLHLETGTQLDNMHDKHLRGRHVGVTRAFAMKAKAAGKTHMRQGSKMVLVDDVLRRLSFIST